MFDSPLPVALLPRSSVLGVTGGIGAGHDKAAREIARRLVGAGHDVRTVDVLDFMPLHLGHVIRWLYFLQLRIAPQFSPDQAIDAIIMDIGLPDSDGRDVCQALKSAGQHAPVLFLARLEVLLRRGPAHSIGDGNLRLDPTRHAVITSSGEASLTPTEFRMLASIASRPGEVVRRRTVVSAAWPDGAIVSENTIDSFIRRIRVKLDEAGATTSLETVRGVGFRLK